MSIPLCPRCHDYPDTVMHAPRCKGEWTGERFAVRAVAESMRANDWKLRAERAESILASLPDDPNLTPGEWPTAEAEVERLRAEVTKWQSADAQWRSQWSQYVHPAREEDVQEIALLRAEVERLRATGLRHLDYFKAMRERHARAEARAEHAESVARGQQVEIREQARIIDAVRALVDEWLLPVVGPLNTWQAGDALRAILDAAPEAGGSGE